ncbi:hypothetical protein BU17DRAFT_81648 [Hysterangium stoloniferum]|nr:hypothetical protein BU17DRAFT_81648 [Hysterangium stoloniferum]
MGRNNTPLKDPSSLEAGPAVPDVSMTERNRPELQDSVEKRPYLKLLLEPVKGILQIPRKQLVPLLTAMRTVDPMTRTSTATSDNPLSTIHAESSIDHLELFRRQGWILHAITTELDLGAELWPSLTSGAALELLFGDTENLTTSGIVRPALELMNAHSVNDDDVSEYQRLKTFSSSIATPSLPVFQSPMSATTLPTLIFTSASFRSIPIEDPNSEQHTLTPLLTMPSTHCGLHLAVADYADKVGDTAGVESDLGLWSHVPISDDALDEEYSFLDDASLRLLDDFPSPPQEPRSSCILSAASTRQAESTVEDMDSLQRKMSHRKKVPSLLETDGLRDEDIMEIAFDHTGICESLTAFRRQYDEYTSSVPDS